jgi:hypothetical protein
MNQTTAHRQPEPAPNLRRTTAFAQALFYLGTGIWPWISMRTFLKVTGPKEDLWLVKTVGALVAVIGAVVGLAALRRRLTPEIGALGAGSAGALAGVDLLFVAQGRIPPVYLLDMVAELGLVGVWLLGSRTGGFESRPY